MFWELKEKNIIVLLILSWHSTLLLRCTICKEKEKFPFDLYIFSKQKVRNKNGCLYTYQIQDMQMMCHLCNSDGLNRYTSILQDNSSEQRKLVIIFFCEFVWIKKIKKTSYQSIHIKKAGEVWLKHCCSNISTSSVIRIKLRTYICKDI